jgi:hypothetical protein
MDVGHRWRMLRFLLLRFLPRRLVPLLFLVEAFRLLRRWQTRDDPTIGRPRRARSGTFEATSRR